MMLDLLPAPIAISSLIAQELLTLQSWQLFVVLLTILLLVLIHGIHWRGSRAWTSATDHSITWLAGGLESYPHQCNIDGLFREKSFIFVRWHITLILNADVNKPFINTKMYQAPKVKVAYYNYICRHVDLIGQKSIWWWGCSAPKSCGVLQTPVAVSTKSASKSASTL